ncbi:hypothetical protein HF285_04765 [Acidithiobacillus ferrooxidans F221]|uniref:hypothetical protein n=1 Tax=Acidithiobacillus ferrooxidans TaxID=920 RepID=UPI001C07EDC1|nr:hypothetical protein [Acidithiobacillus ferrooxidans]MBU2807594.1 hypothetical protein [Acidithiobacillus ferrooxidans F221]
MIRAEKAIPKNDEGAQEYFIRRVAPQHGANRESDHRLNYPLQQIRTSGGLNRLLAKNGG